MSKRNSSTSLLDKSNTVNSNIVACSSPTAFSLAFFSRTSAVIPLDIKHSKVSAVEYAAT
jgi:hypothetical protein